MTRTARLLGWTSIAAMAGVIWLGVSAPRHDWFLWGMGMLAISGWWVAGYIVVAVSNAEPPR